MSEHRSSGGLVARRTFLASAGGAATLGIAGCTGLGGGASSMTIFHAGSLAAPFSDVEPMFEEDTGIQVNREAKGSVGSTNKITEQGRAADILGVSDFRLIRDMMQPEFADWYGIFVTNAMAIGYTDQSKYADEVGTDTWYDVLSRDDVKVAHSDPAVDPNGYRSVMAMELGSIAMDGKKLYDDATAKALKKNAEITSGTETDLIGQLESGALDYAWEYQSAGAAHEDLRIVDLQPHVDLARATNAYAEHYSKAEVKAGGTTYTGAPIAYGITVPSVAERPDAGAKWVEYVTTGPGEQIMTDHGFQTVSPMVVPEEDEKAVPRSVMDGATAKASLGPLKL